MSSQPRPPHGNGAQIIHGRPSWAGGLGEGFSQDSPESHSQLCLNCTWVTPPPCAGFSPHSIRLAASHLLSLPSKTSRAPTPASSAFRPEPGLAHSPLPKVALIQAASTFQDAKPTGFVSACDSPAPQRPLCPADHALLPLTRSAVSALALRGEHKRRGLQSHLPNSDGPGATQP